MLKRTIEHLFPKILIIFISIVLALLFAEIILRFYGPKYYKFGEFTGRYYTNPRGYHKPMGKDGRYTIYGLSYNASPEGYRLPYASLPKQSNKDNFILSLGDSFTWGAGVKYEDIYLVLLEGFFS
ncbi:MAG: hypothetical protein JW734_08590 [Candidatus Omnitrophica bacterium]|nr:hypothetical protein [Candidatus Omnitrophota bacterium]